MNKRLYNLAIDDAKLMLRACIELPQYIERMRALEAIIRESEEEKTEAYRQYESKVFHLYGRRDKQQLDKITDDCEREIVRCKLEWNDICQLVTREFTRIIEIIENASLKKKKIENSEDVLDVLLDTVTVLADLMGAWDDKAIANAVENRLFQLDDEQEEKFSSISSYRAVVGASGGTAFVRARGHDTISIGKRESLESKIRRAESEIEKMNAEGKKREKRRNGDKGWER